MNKEINKLYKLKFIILLFFLCLGAIFYGCGSSGNISDWADSSNIIRVSNLRGRIIPPISNNSIRNSSEPLFSLVSTAGTKVFIEDNSNLFAYTDSSGFFVIPNVPEGKHRVIANIVAGTTTYRQRSDVITVTGEYETQEIQQSIELSPALYNTKIHVLDLNTSSPVVAQVCIWGYVFNTINGIADVGPFPSGNMSKEVSIKAIGYKDLKTLINFGDDYKSEIYLKMTPLSSADSNQAPTIEIQRINQIVRTNEEIGISGIGVDPEGEAIKWKWSASSGSFYNENSQQTTFLTPEISGEVRISLTGTDPKGASGHAVLNLQVEQGGSPGVNPQNKPPIAPNTPFPENMAKDMDGKLLLTWNCSDPNNDQITYTVNFGKQGSELKTIATDLKESQLSVKGLEADTTYYWQVTAYDVYYASTDSELWQFSTGNLNNQAPNFPTYPTPANYAKNIEDHVTLSWSGGDPEGDPVTYKIYFATASTWIPSDPTELKLIQTTNLLRYDYYGLAKGATYQWRIIATDKYGAIIEGPIWQFSTIEPENNPPSYASITEPQSEATNVSVNQKLRWTATDEDGDVLYYDVYFGKEPDPPLVSASQPSQIYDPGTLENNTTYYWRISVSDGRIANPKSDIWSFTTEEITDEKPYVVSITTPSSITSPFRITFSEYIDNSKESEAFKFTPNIPGNWSWSAGNTIAEFMPDEGKWLPGSYNRFNLESKILEDATGNKIETSTEKKFEIPSSIPVPAGYHSYAFPLELAANKTVEITVPDLEYGKNAYVVAVAGESGKSNIRASQDINTNSIIDTTDPTYALRLLEKDILRKGLKIPENNKSVRASVSAASIGDIKDFYLNEIATTTSYPKNIVHARLTKMSQNTLVYVDEAIEDSGKEYVAENVLNVFDFNILQKVRNNFGNEPSVGVDGESRISIVLVNIAKNNSTAGYYYCIDLFPRENNEIFRESNECKVFYIKYDLEDTTIFGTLAHEFQHMINFYQKNQSLVYSNKVDEKNWINEGLSKYSEEICGYSMLDGDYNTTVLVDYSMTNNKDLSLTYWGPKTINCYGQVYLFMHFLAYPGRYNSSTSAITRSLASGNGIGLIGYENIESVTHETFKETMGKFAISLMLNNYSSTSPTAYGIHNIDLTGKYNGYRLSGYNIENISGPVSLSGMPYENSVRFFRKSSSGSGDTTISISTGNRPVTLWLLDERD